jgi:hypothetical protein
MAFTAFQDITRLASATLSLLLCVEQVNMTDLQAVLSDYVACIISPDPGFSCPLASSIMTADYVYSKADGSRSYAPRNYVGVLQYMPDIQVGVWVVVGGGGEGCVIWT